MHVSGMLVVYTVGPGKETMSPILKSGLRPVRKYHPRPINAKFSDPIYLGMWVNGRIIKPVVAITGLIIALIKVKLILALAFTPAVPFAAAAIYDHVQHAYHEVLSATRWHRRHARKWSIFYLDSYRDRSINFWL